MSDVAFFACGTSAPSRRKREANIQSGTDGEANLKDFYRRRYCFSPVRSSFVQKKRLRTPMESSHLQNRNLARENILRPTKQMNNQGINVTGQENLSANSFEMNRMQPNALLMGHESTATMRIQHNHSFAWNERFQELIKYKSEHGDCLVPQRYPQNTQLGVWVNKQRAEYKLMKEGKKSSMTYERIQSLESVGFVWAKRRKGQPTWDLKFDELILYKRKHGDCLVPTKYTENPALGRWVSTQRAQYKLMQEGKESTMTRDRVTALEDVGFVWRLQF